MNHLVKGRVILTDRVANWQDLRFKHKTVR